MGGDEERARYLRSEIRRLREQLLDLYAAEHFDVVRALEIQRDLHRAMDRLREIEARK